MILAGGIGSRFWPVSTPSRPKQLLPLASGRALIADTVARIAPLVPDRRLRILTSPDLEDAILRAVPALGPEHLLLEPRARGTAPVLAWAASEIVREEPDAIMVSLHADHVISSDGAFRDLIAEIAGLAAERDQLYTIGIQPNRPETGYGYIRVGDRLGPALEVYQVADFVEKPDRDTAHEYLHRGGYLWNSGIFIWRASTLLAEIERCTPELAVYLPLLEEGRIDEFYERAPALSIDEGVIERSERVAVARATFEWDDVGAWDAVGRTREADAQGNTRAGDAHLVESEGCIAWAEQGSIVVYGGHDLVVVRTAGMTFVAPRERTPELKSLLAQLPERLRRVEE